MRNFVVMVVMFFYGWALTLDKPNIAILELDGSGISKTDLKGLTNRLQTEFFKTDRYTVLERNKIDEILKEQQFQMTGCTDLACAVEIGRMLNVELIVIGNVDKVGSIYSVNLRLVDVSTGRIIKNEIDDCHQCTLDQVFLNTLKSAVYKIAGLEPDTAPVTTPPSIETRTVQPGLSPRLRPPSRFKMGFYLGLIASSSMDAEDKVTRIEHAGGMDIGMTYDIPLSGNWFLKPEFVYSNRKAELYGDDFTDILHYLDVPILISRHLTSFSQVFIGPSFGFLMGSSYNYYGDEGEYEEDVVNQSINRLIFGVEVNLGSLRLGYRFANDLSRERDTAHYKVSRNIQYLTVAIMFRR